MSMMTLNRNGGFQTAKLELDARPSNIPGPGPSYEKEKIPTNVDQPGGGSSEESSCKNQQSVIPADTKSSTATIIDGDDDDCEGSVDDVRDLLLSSVLQFSCEEDKQQLRKLCDQIKKLDNERRVQTDQLLDMYYERVEDDMPIEDIISKHLKGSDSCKTETMETMDSFIPNTNSTTKPEIKLEKKKELKPELTCKVCLDNQVAVTFVPCGHLVTCVSCTAALFECPVCRAQIRGTIRTYL